jgi:glycerophosphoryl diester phosphodiesterase
MSELTRSAPLRRVGHKGADLIAPGNTRASFDAALAAGVDMIEFDVLPVRWPADNTTPLVLAHDHEHLTPDAPTLEDGLDHLASEPFGGVELDLDLKLPGYEAQVVDALRARGLVERTLISSQYMRSLVAIRALEPGLRLGWSVPRVRRDYTKSWVYVLPALSALAVMRRRLPGLAAGHVGAGRVDAVMAHQRLATPELLRAVHGAGGEVYVWTIDDAEEIRRLEAMGADAVITNDPRLFVR